MASTPSKAKKARTKPPRGRPAATSAISQPAVVDASSLSYLSTFSPRGDLFAFLSLAVDKHRLRVYDTATRQSVAEHVVDTARVTSVCWYDSTDTAAQMEEDEETASQPKKKRKQRHSKTSNVASTSNSPPQAVVLGLSDGTLTFFSPRHGRIVRTLSHPSSTTDILSVAVGLSGSEQPSVWTSSADGTIRLWDASTGDVTSSWHSGDKSSYRCLAPRSFAEEEGPVDVLAAHHTITLLSVSPSSSEAQVSGKQKPREVARFTGHASPVKSLHWCDASQFISIAEADRFVYVWDVPEKPTVEGKIAASIPLDSDARSITLSTSLNTTQQLHRDLLAVSASGKISVFPLDLNSTATERANSKQKIPTLVPRSIITVSTKDTTSAQVVAATFVAGEEGRIRIARLVNGVQPIFDVVSYFDESSDYIPEVVISASSAMYANGTGEASATLQKRYNEPSSLAVRSGVELGQDPSMDDLPTRDVDGDLDVDLAELSLGQRLTALTGNTDMPGRTSSDSDSDGPGTAASSRQRTREGVPEAVPASSLTRTLIQALHSSDARLLETCLAHSNPTLIRNTVRRLPAQLAVPLVTACVERLGRRARAANMKGGGGGASSQRGAALLNWVKAVLVAHSGHLMTMPDLVARLSGLHATLTTRLTLQDSLLALSGRLEMVVSQIEMRSSGPPAPLPLPKGKGKQPRKREARRYVEGESEEEEEQMEVEVESGDESGSVEDVELGGDSDEDEDDSGDGTDEDEDGDEDSDEDEDEEDDGGGGLKVNGFIDDEAEEYSEDEDDSASE
ncbi:NUC189-domain-containing protein [Amylocystis lapponica]|nr:NUC189-domain-containing protein [Amylocystis lapponica]